MRLRSSILFCILHSPPRSDYAVAFLQQPDLFRRSAGKNNLNQIRLTGQENLPFQQDLPVFPAADLHRPGLFAEKYGARGSHFDILRSFCRQRIRDCGYGGPDGQVHGLRTDLRVQIAQKDGYGLQGSIPFAAPVHIHIAVGCFGRLLPAPALELFRHIAAIQREFLRHSDLQPEIWIGIDPAFNGPGCPLQFPVSLRYLLRFPGSCRGFFRCIRCTACLRRAPAAAGQGQHDQKHPQQEFPPSRRPDFIL